MEKFPYMVLVPRSVADETTMGEWLELHNIEYVTTQQSERAAHAFEFYFASKLAADAFARTFVG